LHLLMVPPFSSQAALVCDVLIARLEAELEEMTREQVPFGCEMAWNHGGTALRTLGRSKVRGLAVRKPRPR